MKVLKEGIWNVPWSAEMTCGICKALLLVEENDVKATDYSSSNTFHFMCVVCGKANAVPPSELPLRVQEEKNKKRKSSGSWGGRD